MKMISQDLKKLKLPDSPGVYFFLQGKKILYIGKATSIQNRVKSYFSHDLIKTRGYFLVKMTEEATTIKFEKTDSVLEALILEVNYIKKFQPQYNSKEKDDKSYNYVAITKEDFPRVLLVRGKELDNGLPAQTALRFVAGPFPHGNQLREALKIVRKIFPFRDKCTPAKTFQGEKFPTGKPCFNRQIGLCPGVCTGEVSQKEYIKTIKNIELFFSGKKTAIVRNLEREMKAFSKDLLFEKAQFVKNQIFALDHIRDVSLLKPDLLMARNGKRKTHFRIEAYDVAHLSGRDTVGVMVVLENGELNKNEYRKFKIRGEKGEITIDDTKNLKEILIRRMGHAEWQLPNLIVIDGATAQINAVKEILKDRNYNIDLVSVVKDDKHKAKEIIGKKRIIERHKREILLSNSEAHRFAIAFHKNRRKKSFIPSH